MKELSAENDRNDKPWDANADVVVYSDDRYTLGQKDGFPYFVAEGKRYFLKCHPYEPCLYITDENGFMTTVHNAFDPRDVIEMFYKGKTVTSITGREYSPIDFCKVVEYAAGMFEIGINTAETILGDKEKKAAPEKRAAENVVLQNSYAVEGDEECETFDDFPDAVVDHVIVKGGAEYDGIESHRRALALASRQLFIDGSEIIWNYDVRKASGKMIDADALLDPLVRNGKLNYRKAFLYPPYENGYTDKDFKQLTATLFPSGKEALDVCEWTTDWSEYFDDGHEWWGALCYTVYDKKQNRFVVIMASATD